MTVSINYEKTWRGQDKKKFVPLAYRMATESHFDSQIVLQDLDLKMTQNFITKCKEEKVTVNRTDGGA